MTVVPDVSRFEPELPLDRIRSLEAALRPLGLPVTLLRPFLLRPSILGDPLTRLGFVAHPVVVVEERDHYFTVVAGFRTLVMAVARADPATTLPAIVLPRLTAESARELGASDLIMTLTLQAGGGDAEAAAVLLALARACRAQGIATVPEALTRLSAVAEATRLSEMGIAKAGRRLGLTNHG